MKKSKQHTFIDYVNEKYKDEIYDEFFSKKFTTWDDYALWLYYRKYKLNIGAYYSRLEDDLKEYSDMQTKGVAEDYTGYWYMKDEVPKKW